MKKFILPFLIFAIYSNAQIPCENGYAEEYPCNNIDLMSFIPNETFGANRGNDCWGWTDSQTGKEYALFCNSHNTAFIDITDPINPIYIGKLNTHSTSSIWRDVKVYKNHAFIVSEAGGHGMQVFDLTRLRNVVDTIQVFTEDAHNDSFGGAHNIVINEATGYAYIVGAGLYNGGPVFINIKDPLNPINDGGFGDAGYTHDAHVIIYNGPDTEHTGKELYFGANASSINIIDVTDKANPKQISQFSYPFVGYTHQLWVGDDHKYIFSNDEFDENQLGINTRNIVFDITDLDNPVIEYEYFGPTTATDHNNYTVGDKLYIANYKAGLRVVDISEVKDSNMHEIAYFDSYPENDNAGYDGAWSVYPYFKSGNVIISDIAKGFFVVRETGILSIEKPEVFNTNYSVFPNPVSNNLHLESSDDFIYSVQVFDFMGKKIMNKNYIPCLEQTLNTTILTPGFYFLKINNMSIIKIVKSE